jgi:radical SAM modification target selenobiotic family peptide
MNIDEIKKVLANLCLATLVSGAGLALVVACSS